MYTILVKIEGFERRKRNAGLLHVVLGFFLVLKSFDYYYYSEYTHFWAVLPFLVVAALSLYYGFFRKRIDPSGRQNLALRSVQAAAFVAFALAMMRVGKSFDYYSLFIWALLTVVLMFTERKIFNDTVVTIEESGVLVPGFYGEHLVKWPNLETVVVRHDFLTLIHRNNKYMQFQVMQTLSELEVAKMNAFCTEKIEAGTSEVNSEA